MGKKLYVGNLPFSTTDEDLRQLFGSAGQLDSVKVVTDRDTGRSRGFAFVEFANEDEAQAAGKQFNGTDMQGRPLTVNEAKPQAPREGGFGGDRGGGGGGRGGRGGRGFNDRPRW
jgi:RNA recognition motif-containing protein